MRGAVVSTLAGGVSGTNGAYADASGTLAGFNQPAGVAVDASGNVFVADSSNQLIRKVMAGGGTRIGQVTLFDSVAVRTRTWLHRRERVGHLFWMLECDSDVVIDVCFLGGVDGGGGMGRRWW